VISLEVGDWDLELFRKSVVISGSASNLAAHKIFPPVRQQPG